jgi:hypothetical protein
LWKATKKLKQVEKPSPPFRTSQGTWARSNVKKAHAFPEHLTKVFQSHPSENEPEEEEAETHFCKTETTRNRPDQNVSVIQMKVNTLYKRQTFHI